MEWTRERQEQAISDYIDEAFKQATFTFMANREALKSLVRERMLGEGFDTYGDATFHITEEELFRGKLEEAADFIVYHIIGMARTGE